MLKFFVFIPDDQALIDSIVDAASNAGAGRLGKYSHVYFSTKGIGNWKSEEGAHPAIGKVGEMSHEPEMRIEMLCPEDKAGAVERAIREIHPYEEPEIDFIELKSLK